MNLKISINKLHNNSAIISFILLFPGFFFYHFSVARGYVPEFLGGYFGNISIIILPALLFLFAKKYINKLYLIDKVFFLLMGLWIFIAFVNYSLGRPHGFSSDVFIWSVSGVLFNVVCYLVAIKLHVVDHSKKLLLIFFIMVGMVILNIGDQGIFYVAQEFEGEAGQIASYQGFARSLLVISMLLTGLYWKKSKIFYFVIFASFIGLFFNGARSEFVAYAVGFISISLIYSFKSPSFGFKMISLFVCLSALVYYFTDVLPDSRLFQLLDIGSASSFIARMELQSYSITLLKKNPIMGAYGGYVDIGGIGSYAHNIISSWVNLGLLGFLSYVLTFSLMWVVALKKIFTHMHLIDFRIFLFFLVCVTFLLLFAKDYSYMLFGFLVGLFSKYRKNFTNFNTPGL